MGTLTQEFGFQNKNCTDIGAWQHRLKRKLRLLLGLMPPVPIPLNVRTLWRHELEWGRVEKIVFASEPGADIPAYVCLPWNTKPPYDWMICLQGHTSGMHLSVALDQETERKPIEIAGDRDFARSCVKKGMAALCIEQRSFGERNENMQKQVSPHGCHDAAMQALLVGRTLLGERLWDVDRAIDYIETRADARLETLGIMGNSTGGTLSLYAAALLPRIRFSMPSCCFCTFINSIGSIYHCVDNYIPGILRYAEMADILGLFAPKPVVLVAGKYDNIFPIKATRRAFKHLKEIYRAAGAEERCHLLVGKEGHRFYADLAWPVALREIERLHLVKQDKVMEDV